MTATNANWEWKRNWGMKKDSERNGGGCVENQVSIDEIWTKQNKNRVIEKGDTTRVQSKNIYLLNKLE